MLCPCLPHNLLSVIPLRRQIQFLYRLPSWVLLHTSIPNLQVSLLKSILLVLGFIQHDLQELVKSLLLVIILLVSTGLKRPTRLRQFLWMPRLRFEYLLQSQRRVVSVVDLRDVVERWSDAAKGYVGILHHLKWPVLQVIWHEYRRILKPVRSVQHPVDIHLYLFHLFLKGSCKEGLDFGRFAWVFCLIPRNHIVQIGRHQFDWLGAVEDFEFSRFFYYLGSNFGCELLVQTKFRSGLWCHKLLLAFVFFTGKLSIVINPWSPKSLRLSQLRLRIFLLNRLIQDYIRLKDQLIQRILLLLLLPFYFIILEHILVNNLHAGHLPLYDLQCLLPNAISKMDMRDFFIVVIFELLASFLVNHHIYSLLAE